MSYSGPQLFRWKTRNHLTSDNLGNLSHEFHIEGYSQFGVLTGVRISVILSRVRKNPDQISWERAFWTPLTCVSDRVLVLRVNRYDIGKALSERRIPTFG